MVKILDFQSHGKSGSGGRGEFEYVCLKGALSDYQFGNH